VQREPRWCEWCALALRPGTPEYAAGIHEACEPAKAKAARARRKAKKGNTFKADGEGGWLVVRDATADLYVFVTKDDVACATPLDQTRCAIAKAVRRTVGDEAAAAEIHRTMAYVKALDSKGEWYWLRFWLPNETRRLIDEFDRTGETNPGGYRLQAVPAWRTLGRQREAWHRSAARKRAGTTQPRAKTENRRAGKVVSLADTVRNGSGHVPHRVVEVP
jgi:hypothetical protein